MMPSKPQFVGERVSFTDTFSEVSRGVKKFKQNQYVEYGAHPIVDQGQELIAVTLMMKPDCLTTFQP